MTISLESFGRAAAAGGLLNVDQGGADTAPQVGKMSFGGRVAQWFPSEGTKEANRQTTQSFVASLEQRFGTDFATRASQQMSADSGKPLSARVVSDFIRQGEAHARQVIGLNVSTAMHFSEDTAPHSQHSMGKVFADLAAARNMSLQVDDPDLNLDSMQRAISREIGNAGTGNRVVSLEQARGIAEKHVGRLLDNKAALLETCERLTTDPGERAMLCSFVLSHDIAKPQIMEALWNTRQAAVDLLATLGTPDLGTDATIGALHGYFLQYDAAAGPLGRDNPELGADELVAFNSNLLELGINLAAGNPSGSAEDRGRLEGLWTQLTRPETGALRDALTHLCDNGVEANVGKASLGTLRVLNNTLGGAILQVGMALDRTKDEIADANALQHSIDHINDVPQPVIDALRSRGMGDVNYTAEKLIDEMPDSPVTSLLTDALMNLSVSGDVRKSGDLSQMTAQLEVINDRLGKLAGVVAPPDAVGVAATLRAGLERVQDAILSAGDRIVRQANAGKPDLNTLQSSAYQHQLAQRLDDWATGLAGASANAPPANAAKFQDLVLDLRSEAGIRREPEFLLQDAEDQERAVTNRQQFGRIIGEDLKIALDRPIQAATRVESKTQSEQMQVRMNEVRTGGGFDANMEAVDRIRMGSSDTIAGKSGGGEVEGGASRATQNWKNANARAGEIARSGQPLTLENIRELNRLLNVGMPANDGVAGEFRTRTETAGGGPSYLTPERIEPFMNEFMDWLATNQDKLDPIELAGLAYQKLVSIHPFSDANGRTCRLVADIILQSHGLPPAAFQGSDEVNVSVFAVPSGKNPVNLTPDDAVQRMTRAVQRSLDILGREG